jgi:hypothetical protein
MQRRNGSRGLYNKVRGLRKDETLSDTEVPNLRYVARITSKGIRQYGHFATVTRSRLSGHRKAVGACRLKLRSKHWPMDSWTRSKLKAGKGRLLYGPKT